MNSTLDTTLQEVAEETFSSLAFLMPLSAEEQQQMGATDTADARLTVRVEFSGPFTGSIVLSVDAGMLQPLAANMLGQISDASSSVEQQHDALKELLNVICGNLLPRIATPREVFKVHSPELLDEHDAHESGEGKTAEARISLWLESGRADLALFCEYPLAAPAV